MNKDPHCHWCGIEVFDIHSEIGTSPPHNQATVDHIYSRLHPERGKPGLRVLACYGCNHRRGEEEVALLPIEEVRRRSIHAKRRTQ